MVHSPDFRAVTPGLESVAGARIAVAHPSFATPLPLARLDRRGLVFRAVGAMPAACWLPHAATLLSDDEPLCSLRLVIRTIAAAGGDRHDVTMQPSCAADDEVLWHALRRRRPYRQVRDFLSPVGAVNETAEHDRPPSAAANDRDGVMRLTRSAAFRLTCRDDALFFADWLEYHFDELRALSQYRAPQLQLSQLEHRLVGNAVGVRFVYGIDGEPTRHALNDCAHVACTWIETEMRDKFAVPIAQEWLSEYRP